jgi:hypothetical protein
MTMRKQVLFLFAAELVFLGAGSEPALAGPHLPTFLTSDNCMACHNGLVTKSGEDVSIGYDWRATMMAHSARDPYWQAGVRRELHEHPSAAAAIENECSRCHMPMANEQAHAQGKLGQVFANLAPGAPRNTSALAVDGVSCTVCHQIQPDNLGKPSSFVGGFVVDAGARKMFGPFTVEPELARLMHSATTFTPTQSPHLGSAELCATCHTLFTEALGPGGQTVGRLPEQVPYLEWKASDFAGAASCIDCHMPQATSAAPMASIAAQPRSGLRRHEFLGGNFVIPGILRRLNTSMPATPQDFTRAIASTRQYLADEAAELNVRDVRVEDGRLACQIGVTNKAGHKLPTAYPSRRAWLHVVVNDRTGAAVFESGALRADGHIDGNDNDQDPTRFEQHHTVIDGPDKVQIYEAILGDVHGRVTTGLLNATGYLKDNRILPSGLERAEATGDIAIHGEAARDDDFVGGGDTVKLSVPVQSELAPFTVVVELIYQPIGFRWAENLRGFDLPEPRAFTRMFSEAAPSAYQRLARAQASTPAPPTAN